MPGGTASIPTDGIAGDVALGADGPGLGGLAQEASNAAVAIIVAIRQNGSTERCGCNGLADRQPGLKGNFMTLLLLEALGALLLLLFIVWWTMFSGRKNGELKDKTASAVKDEKKDALKDAAKKELAVEVKDAK